MDDIKIKCFVCFKSPLPSPNVENGPVGIGPIIGSVIEKDAGGDVTSKTTECQSKVIFLIKKILEIPDNICNGFSDNFQGSTLSWKNLCSPCLALVEKTQKIFEQIISLEMYKNLQTEIKNKILSANFQDKIDNEQNHSVREIVRSYISKAMGDTGTYPTNKSGKGKTISENGDFFIASVSRADPSSRPDLHFKNKYEDNVKCEMNYCDDYYSENDERSNEDNVNNVKANKISHDLEKSKESFVCDSCGRSFIVRINLENHLARIHMNFHHYGDISEEKKQILLNRWEKEKKVSEEKRKCDICQKIFKDRNKLRKHYVSHTGEKAYQCDICGNKFSTAGNLKYHKNVHTVVEKSHLCNVCGKTFRFYNGLKLHVKIHTDEKPFECKTCGKCFIRSCTLKEHIRTHTGERPYKCSYCGKAFGTSSCLKTHVKIHTGEKPYTCEQCGKSFSEPGYLRKHTKSHGEKVVRS